MMNVVKKRLLAFLILLLSTTVFAQQKTRIDWDIDLNYFLEELPQKHYNLFSQKDKAYFFSEVARIKQESKNLTNIDVALKIQQLLASLGDSHTSLDYRPFVDKDQILPLQMYWFHDGLYVLRTTKEYADIVGCKVISINQFSVEAIADSLSGLFTVDNQSVVKQNVVQLISLVQILKHFNLTTDNNVEIVYRTQAGKNKTITIKPKAITRDNLAAYTPSSIAFCYQNEKAYFAEKHFDDGKIYYLQYNRCWSKELESKFGKKDVAAKLPSFLEFENKIFKILESKAINKIIFDLRFNGGGNSKQGTDFISKLSNYLKDNPEIKLYVVLGRKTFSSAILNALDFKRMTNAIFVGEETTGKPNHFGELRKLQLPSSKLSIYYSTKYFKYSDDDLKTLHPDILIETSFDDFSKGVDPVFNWIKEN